ncbi:peptidase S8 and S53 subtilisin kexin sedolisin [Ornithinimicrobium avium]|uniref:Peptidase S8 and S53 subtilisin kexin sedolisin n=2 Tax=Ornithinimicrobium avium TaxID=2283195 RepID=A0A345NMU8_9MICO|nr:peptidase S8 and S53 subtilisin kexin sedolisin [Ornithinimicrobium avium]
MSLAALLTPLALAGGAAGASPADPVDRFVLAPRVGAVDPVVLPVGADDDRTVQVMVQLSRPSVSEVQASSGTELSKGQKKQLVKQIKAQQRGVVAAARADGGTVLAQTQHAINGVKVSIARNKVADLAAGADVLAVRPVVVHHLENATAIPFLGVPQVWQDTGYTGEGVKVAIIDTGIDYTHADFGGPGTVDAYEAADATDTAPADPALFGPDAPRVKGGRDFVGDDYDASEPGSVPQPDPNPLDCQGHGSHVAGSTGGSGVLADGSTYEGPYDASTPDTDFLIGPGVAPEVDLYALRVFGCAGSTDVTVEAIDWAVANDMDVINMSLGSDYGYADDSTAIASANAAAAGVVVVASAGNAGHNPYLVGSPSTARGVLSVAAVDPTATYPGVQITLPDGAIPAISANGIIPEDGTAYDVVVLEDIPGTTEDESLGCSVEAFTENGIADGGNQLAVTVRGTCARVARGVFGQQAGAAAVAMINTDPGFPPYEGPILDNPDTGAPYTVTIPFLGVRGVLGPNPTDDGDQLVAADGQPVSMVGQILDNPGYTDSAGFTSGGPRSGDSGLAPNVAAPGVAIESAAVGTGYKGVRMSGTSMAAPMTSGVAALGVQAHPEWTAYEVTGAIISSADRDNVGDYALRITGNGLVDAMQTVTTDTVAFGDKLETGGWESTLNFGFVESAKNFNATKKVTVVNKGTTTQTYRVSTVASPDSLPANVTVSPSRITVKPGRTASVTIKLSARAADVPTSLGGDQWSFHEISGQVRLSADSGELNVPYLMVPRSLAQGDAKGPKLDPAKKATTKVTLVNKGGALPAAMDFYTWGLSDGQDVDYEAMGGQGYDLRAAGVQSFPEDDVMVFAINNWDRWSNAASLEHDVLIDVDGDGVADQAVFALDYGLVTSGSADGMNAVFTMDLATGAMDVYYLATSPTDSSTLLMPVPMSALGVTDGTSFSYEVASFDLAGAGFDVMDGTAVYDPWNKAFDTDGYYTEVAPGASQKLQITADLDAWREQSPLGQMIVVLDNAAGEDEALLLGSGR